MDLLKYRQVCNYPHIHTHRLNGWSCCFLCRNTQENFVMLYYRSSHTSQMMAFVSQYNKNIIVDYMEWKTLNFHLKMKKILIKSPTLPCPPFHSKFLVVVEIFLISNFSNESHRLWFQIFSFFCVARHNYISFLQ